MRPLRSFDFGECRVIMRAIPKIMTAELAEARDRRTPRKQ